MKLKSTGMKWLRFLHLISSSIWFGGSVCAGGLAVIGIFSGNSEVFLSVVPVIPKLYSNVVFYMAIFTLIQGLIYGFFTNWGFFKYRWLLLKWILVILLIPCTAMGIIQTFTAVARVVYQGAIPGGIDNGGKALFFIACQVILMIVIIFLSIFKPGRKSSAAK